MFHTNIFLNKSEIRHNINIGFSEFEIMKSCKTSTVCIISEYKIINYFASTATIDFFKLKYLNYYCLMFISIIFHLVLVLLCLLHYN